MKSVFMRLAAAAAIVSMGAPAMAEAANPAAKLSLGRSGSVRAATPAKKAGGIAPVVINIAILAALSAGVLIATTTGDDDDADSN